MRTIMKTMLVIFAMFAMFVTPVVAQPIHSGYRTSFVRQPVVAYSGFWTSFILLDVRLSFDADYL